MVHHSACPLCSSDRIELKFKCRDFLSSKKEFPVFECHECSFSFTQDYPEENEIGAYYESDEYISHSDTSRGFVNKLYRLVRTFMLSRKKRLIIRNTGLKKGRLLDVGSGTGYFPNAMKEAGWDVTGIEINDKARDFSISNFGLNVISPVKMKLLPASAFDCITLWHVLEHFHNPEAYMADLRMLLKPGALCVIALPNCYSYDALYYRNFWAAWDVPRHLWHFSPLTFKIFAEKCGFKLEKWGTLPLDVFYISQLSEKYRGSAMPFLAGTARSVLFAFHSLFSRARCSSIIYILRLPLNQ